MGCVKGRRCKSFFTCSVCGGHLQKKRFKNFTNSYTRIDTDIITYIVIKPSKITILEDNLNTILNFMDDLRTLKKNKKIGDFYSRLEVSFSKDLGFNPHLNILSFGDFTEIKKLLKDYDLTFWSRKKENNKDTIFSIIWYMLKFNSIGKEQGKAVKTALNRRRAILYSNRFTPKKDSCDMEFIDTNFSFLGTKPIRSKEEVFYRKEIAKERKKINLKLKKFLSKLPPYIC